MGTTKLVGEKMRGILAETINPFGIVNKFQVGAVRGIVRVNGREEMFEIEGLEIEAVPIVVGRTSAPAGKLKLAAVNGEAV